MDCKKKYGVTRLTRADRSEREMPIISNLIVPYSKLTQKENASPTTKQLNELKDDAKELKLSQPQHVSSLQSLK